MEPRFQVEYFGQLSAALHFCHVIRINPWDDLAFASLMAGQKMPKVWFLFFFVQFFKVIHQSDDLQLADTGVISHYEPL